MLASCGSVCMEVSGTSLKGGPMTNKFTVTGEQMAEILRKQTGQMYTNLQKSLVIFICGFDLFGQNRSIYTFETVCRGKSDIVLDDKRKTIFVNIGGDRTEIEKEAADLLDYFRTGNPTDTFTRGLQDEVEKIRQDTEWRENYMTYEMKIELQSRIGREKAEAEARAAGMAEGLAEGKAKGLAEGREQGLAEGKAQGLAEGEAAGPKAKEKELAHKWLRKGKTIQEIAEDLDKPAEYVRELIQET